MKKRLLLLVVLLTTFCQRITTPFTEYLNFRLNQVKLWVFIVLGVCTLHFTAQSQTVTGMSVSNISACYNGTYTAEILVNISFGNRTVTLTGAKLVNSPLELFAVGGSFAVTFYATLIADGAPIALTASLANGSTLTNNNAGTAPALCCTPSVSIVSDDADNSITSGTSVTFTATPTNGGTGATYQWKKNGTNVGNGMTTYTNASLENNDVITCVMTSNAACASPTMVTSNPITISIGSSSTPTNNALNFDGVDDYVNAGTAIANTTVFTLETWVNPATGYGIFNDGGAPIELISRWGAGGAGNASYTLGIDGNGKAVCLTYNGSTGSTATSATTIATNSWTHLAATRASDGTVKIYINGILDVSITGSVVPQSSNYAVFLGKPAVGTNQFKGSMDEVRIWNIVRTQSEIAAAKNAEFCEAQTGLLAYYKMNEGTASGTNTSLTTIADASGSNTGTLVGFARTGSTSNWITSTTSVTGCSTPTTTNNALNFDGVDDYVNAGTAIANTTVFTLETWVNPATGYGTFNDGGAPIELISRWGAAGAGNASYTLGIISSGKAVCYVYNGSSSSEVTSATTVPQNTWTHLAATRASDGTLRIYINGVSDASITGSLVPQSSNYAVFLGKPAVGTNQFKGSLDEVRIWNIVRTQSEISAARNTEFCATQTGLLAYYKMNEGTASGTNTSLTTIADASGSNTGTLSGFARTGSTSNWIASTTGVTGCDACGSTVTPSVSIASNDADNSITTGTSVTFTATPTNGGSTPQYQWKKGSTNVGNNSATYTDATLANGDVITCVLTSSDACASPTTATSAGITMTVTSGCTYVPSNILVSEFLGCFGPGGTYTPNGTVNGAQAWNKANGFKIQWSSTNTRWEILSPGIVWSYNTTGSPTNLPCTGWVDPQECTDAVSISGGCGSLLPTTVTPSISIVSNDADNSITTGTSVTFTATPTNGGSTPQYQWKKGSTNVGTNSATYTNAALANGDVITCVLTSSDVCASPTTTPSNAITMTVCTPVTPTISIVHDGYGLYTPATSSVTFTATITNGGASPQYQWKKGSTNVGGNSATYYNNPNSVFDHSGDWVNGDVITCVLTSNAVCATTTTVTSNAITLLVPKITITANPDGLISFGTPVTFTATTVGMSEPDPSAYVWTKNGMPVNFAFGNTYTDNNLDNGDFIECSVQFDPDYFPEYSNRIQMNVFVAPPPNDNIANAIAATTLPFSHTLTGIQTSGATQEGLDPLCYNSNFNDIRSWWYSFTPTQNGVFAITAGATASSPPYNVITSVYTGIASSLTAVIDCADNNNFSGNGESMTLTATAGTTYYIRVIRSSFSGTPDEITTTIACIPITPSVTIAANPSGSITSGTSVTFTATPTNQGPAPTYQWTKNDINVGNGTATYTDADLANNDVIKCVLTSNATCASTPTATSNVLTMTVLTVTTYTWTGATSTDWATATNWNPNGIPSTIDNVIIPATANKPMLPANQTIANLSLTGTNKIMLGAYNLCVNAITGGSASTYIVTDGVGGLIIKALPTNAPTSFPIGASESSYDPLSISPTNSVDFTAKVKNTAVIGDFTGIGAGAIANFAKVAKREWDITPSAAAGSTILTLTNGGTAYTVVGTPKVGHYRLNTGNTWEELSATHSNGTWTATTTSFSPFGVGEAGGFVAAVLPVELLTFIGYNKGGVNVLNWTTANETNNKGFQVERLNGSDWQILGFKTSNNKSSTYDFTDNNPLSTSYYRLRQLDNDGKETLSKVISVENKGNNKLKVYPNPVSNILTVEANANDVFQIYNLLGQQVLNGKAVQRIDVSALPQGTYFLKVGAEQVKFIKQE